MEEAEKKNKKTSKIFKIWFVMIVLLTITAAGLLLGEYSMHRSWEKEDNQLEAAINIEDLDNFPV